MRGLHGNGEVPHMYCLPTGSCGSPRHDIILELPGRDVGACKRAYGGVCVCVCVCVCVRVRATGEHKPGFLSLASTDIFALDNLCWVTLCY